MTPSRLPAEKLLTSLPTPNRRSQNATTRRALIEVAAKLFAQQGYAGTSLDAIVSGARVTKGALYHHFSGKQAVFEAVFETVEQEASQKIKKALKRSKDPWEKASLGLRAFLDVVQDRAYQRVVIQEGPAVLGYERFREREERYSYGLVQDIVRTVLSASTYNLSQEMVDTFSQIFFGAMSAAGEAVTSAQDATVATARVEAALGFILTGLRALADEGIELPDPITDALPGKDEQAPESEDESADGPDEE